MNIINILVLHSASLNIIKKFCEQNKSDKVYVCTFPKSKGCFLDFAKEIYLKNDSARIDAYKIINQIEANIKELNIDKLVFITSNENAENYENIKVIFNSINFRNKKILSSKLQNIAVKKNFNDYIYELFYEKEDVLLEAYNNSGRNKRKIKNVNKIMFIYDSFYVGGVTNLIYEWIKKLNKKYDIIFSCYSNGTEIDKFKNIENLKLYVNKMDVFESNAELNYYNYLKNIMEKEEPDVVLISGVSTFLPSMLAAIDTEVPKIYPIVNISFYEIYGSVKIGKYLRSFKNQYDSIITVSKSVKDSIIELGINSEKISVIYGSSISINSIETNKNVEQDKRIISCICRISKEKGIDTLIYAISKIDIKKYDNFEVFIVGDGDEKENLETLSKKLNVDNVVKFLGYRNDISNILNKTYISVLASHHEGLPLSILESMAYKKMVIATDVDGIPEVIRHKYNGFLIKENDSDMLAEYIKECLKNPELVERMNENAFKVIKEEFDIDICIEKLIKLIEGDIV